MSRCTQFEKQCANCSYHHCHGCDTCGAHNKTGIPTKCYCIADPDKDEMSCKYYEVEKYETADEDETDEQQSDYAKDETIKVDDFGTQAFDDTKEKTIMFKSPGTAYVDAAEKAFADAADKILFPSLKILDETRGSTVDSTIPDKVTRLEKQVNELTIRVLRLEETLNTTTLKLNILLKRFEL